MKASIRVKLETLVERYEEVQHLLGDPGVIGDQNKFRAFFFLLVCYPEYKGFKIIGQKFKGVDPASTVTCPPLGSTVYKVELEVTAYKGASQTTADMINTAAK